MSRIFRRDPQPSPPATNAPVRRGAAASPVPGAAGARRTRVNCFTPGTEIATPRGPTAIEALRPGDMVVTRDNGPQEIRWAGQRAVSGPALRLDHALRPVRIRAGALGAGVPERDLLVSPNHRVLLLGDHPTLEAAEAEVFVSAHHLDGTRGIASVDVTEVTYLHFMCDRHEVVLSNGAWTESFRPSPTALQGVSERSREELLTIFPELAGEMRAGRIAPARQTYNLPQFGNLRA